MLTLSWLVVFVKESSVTITPRKSDCAPIFSLPCSELSPRLTISSMTSSASSCMTRGWLLPPWTLNLSSVSSADLVSTGFCCCSSFPPPWGCLRSGSFLSSSDAESSSSSDLPNFSRGTHSPMNLLNIPPSTTSNSPSAVSPLFPASPSPVTPTSEKPSVFPSPTLLPPSLRLSCKSAGRGRVTVFGLRGEFLVLRGDSGIGLKTGCFPLNTPALKGRSVER